MKYSLVLFDFDGTLADSFPWFAAIVDDLADRMRFRRVAPDEIDRLRGLGARDVVRHLGIPWWKLPLIARQMRRRMSTSAAAGQIRPFPGVPELLQTLAEQGTRLGVVTSNSEANVRAVLGDGARHIQIWQCRASLFGKAARLRAILRATKVPRDRVLCVGDELRDAEAARTAGVDFAAVTWGYTTRDALVAWGSALVFDSVEQAARALGT